MMCGSNVTEPCGIGICTCTVRPKFEVGQIWETDSRTAKYARIVAIDRKSNTHPIVILYSADLKDEGIAGMRLDGSFSNINEVVRVTKPYVPKRTMKTKLYWWKDRTNNGREWIVRDIDLRNNLNYQHSQNLLLAIKEIELTEGEGLDV